MADERRTSERVRVQVEIGFRSDSNFYVGFSTDLSEGGIFVATVEVLPPGQPVRVEFGLPSGVEIEADGRVAWVRDPRDPDSDLQRGMGVAFTKIQQSAVAAIKEYMTQREPMFYVD